MTVTIRTQKELRAALKDPKVTSIVIKTAKGVTFTIKDGDYSDKKLVISSPKATVKNYASFEKIEIRDGNTVYDRGEGNQIVVKDKNELKLVAGKRAADVNITVASQSGKIQIINNAKDSTIVTAADVSVVLNQSANLTVAEGTKLEKLEVKADASITVAKGAEVQNIAVSGAAQNVALTVDGALANVSIDSKAAVKVGGSTTTAVAIKNNAEGAAIESAVKTDVTLGANAAISFTEGAEGSTVRSEKAEIKPTVDNKTTDKITVTDAAGKETTIDAGKTSDSGSGTTGGGSSSGGTTGGGSTGGGSSSGGSGSGGSSSGGTTGGGSSSGGTTGGDTSEDNKVTFSVAIDGEGSLDALKAGVKLKATAAATADQAAVFTYEWKLGETVVSTTDSYTIKAEDAGKQLVVTATATINGKQQTFTHTPLPVIKAEYAGNNYVDPALSVENGCSEADVIKQLPDKIMIHDAEKINTAEVTVSWGAINYDAETAGTYRFAGNYQLPETWTGVSSQLTANVTVLEAGALNYTVSVASGFTHNEDSKGTDTLKETNENQAAVTLSGSGYDYTITGSLSKLHSFASSNAAQGEGKWIGLLIDVGADVKDQLYFGSSESSLSAITDYEDQVATANQIILWVKADQLANGAITRYMKYGADGTVVPLTIRFENTDVEIRCFDAIAEIDGGTYGSAKEVNDLGLPETVTAYDTKNESHAVKVTWETPAEYQTNANAGSYEFTAKLADDETVIVPQGVELPKVHVVIAKAENTTTCGAPTVDESQTTANSITLTAVSVEGKTVEYACAKTADAPAEGWQDSDTFTGLDAGTTYYFFARVKEEQNYLAGAASDGVSATTSKISGATITAMTADTYDLLYKDWDGAQKDVTAYGTPTFTTDSSDPTKITVTGDLTYVTGFTGFNTAKPEEQEGHYLTLQFAAPEGITEDVSVTCGNKTFGKDTFDDVNGAKIFSLIWRIEDTANNKTITIDWDGENATEYASTTYTLDISGLNLNPEG